MVVPINARKTVSTMRSSTTSSVWLGRSGPSPIRTSAITILCVPCTSGAVNVSENRPWASVVNDPSCWRWPT